MRAAQVKIGEMEIAQAKQKIKYESDYDRAEALRRWPWLRRELSVKKIKEKEKLSVKKKKEMK